MPEGAVVVMATAGGRLAGMTSCVGVLSRAGLALYTSKAVRRRLAEVLTATDNHQDRQHDA
jgi:hypothetical protein